MSLIYMAPAPAAENGCAVGGGISSHGNDVAPTMAPRRRRNCLYLGSKADAKNRDKLQRWGITHILNVTPSKDSSIQSGIPNYFEKSGGFAYKRIPVYDAATSNLLEFAEDIVHFIGTGLCHGSVLVHCQRGVSRSTTCVLFYLMSKANMTLEQALTHVRRRRPEAEPIPHFMAQLQCFEDRCRSLGEGKDEDESKGGAVSRKRSLDTKNNVVGDIGNEIGRDFEDVSNSNQNDGIASNQDQPANQGEVSLETKQVTKTTVKRVMGPSLPPNASNASVSSSSRRPMIGPSPPPPLSATSSEVKKPRIGPNYEQSAAK